MKFVRLFLAMAAIFSVSVCAIAQEGHPLTGTWYGDFGMTAGQRNDLTVVMKWDGANTTGIGEPRSQRRSVKSRAVGCEAGNPGTARNARSRRQSGATGDRADASDVFSSFRSGREEQGRRHGSLHLRWQARKPRSGQPNDCRNLDVREYQRRFQTASTLSLVIRGRLPKSPNSYLN